MDALSLHLCFQVKDNPVTDQDVWNTLQAIPNDLIGSALKPVIVDTAGGGKLLISTGSDGSHCVMHVYEHGLVTIDLQYDSKPHPAYHVLRKKAYLRCKAIETQIQTSLGEKCQFTRSLPAAIQRGKISPYFLYGDSRMFTYGNIELQLEVNSPWQNIKIYKTPDYGSMLCLDDDIMIAESDDIYTHTLLGTDRNEFKDKTILVLGGGDGGILHELLKFSPKHVLMVEIDMEVIETCRKYMRRVCGDSLDQLSGCNYLIRIDNCLNVLKECTEANRKFDYVINDLSEYLVDTEISHENDKLTSAKILDCSINLLEHGGKYLCRGDAASCIDALNYMVHDITSRGLLYEKYTVHVPSFNEKYCLFEIRKPELNGVS